MRLPREHISWFDSATPAHEHGTHSEHDEDSHHSDVDTHAVSVPMAGSEENSVPSMTELFGSNSASEEAWPGYVANIEESASGRSSDIELEHDNDEEEEEDTEVSEEDNEEEDSEDEEHSMSDCTSNSSRGSDPRTPREERQAALNAAALEAREASAAKLPVCAKCRLGLTRKPQGTWSKCASFCPVENFICIAPCIFILLIDLTIFLSYNIRHRLDLRLALAPRPQRFHF